MKKKIIITAMALLSIGFNSCSDDVQLESGKINACKLKHLRERLEQDPSSKVIQDSIRMYEMFVKINRDLYAGYGAGSNEKFNKEIDEYLKDCE
ncbi:MAG: hypothetical protein L3J56_01045 [Bacteroidales bacterium]|nr:hypothetical protein [Bacteroidales bacterium]